MSEEDPNSELAKKTGIPDHVSAINILEGKPAPSLAPSVVGENPVVTFFSVRPPKKKRLSTSSSVVPFSRTALRRTL